MMIVPRKEDAYHKMQLFRLLVGIIDSEEVSSQLCFKGGTCAAMLGFLDRFSVDLDFDLLKGTNKKFLRITLHQVFADLSLKVKDESRTTLQFFLQYEAKPHERNTIKLDILDEGFRADICKAQYLSEIDRFMNCQTIETMFANKLVSLIDRYEKNESIAGRDIYDIHHFFMCGYSYEQKIIKERRGVGVKDFLQELVDFIEEKVTQTVINQDLNTILPKEKFNQIRKVLQNETLTFLRDELKRL